MTCSSSERVSRPPRRSPRCVSGGYDGRVVVLGAEGIAPYDRPPLSKHLLDRPRPTWLADELGADLLALADEVHLSTPARGLSLSGERPEVLTDDGALSADALVVASGAHAVRPPGWEAALTLHTAADAERLRAALVPGARLVVIGAGWIGAEVAGVAAAAGVDVVVVEANGGPLVAALGPTVGELTVPWYAAAGVRLLTGEHVVEVGTNGVSLADGKLIAADVVLAAVGARPTTDWLAGALPREPDGSLRVDEHHRVVGAPRQRPGGRRRRAAPLPAARLGARRALGRRAAGTGGARRGPAGHAGRRRDRRGALRVLHAAGPRAGPVRRSAPRRRGGPARRPDRRGLGRPVVPAGFRRGRRDPHGRPPARRRRRPAAVHRAGPAPARPRAGASTRGGPCGRRPSPRRQCAKWRVPVR